MTASTPRLEGPGLRVSVLPAKMPTDPSLTSGPGPPPARAPGTPASDRLDSWKEIAAYLRRSERTVRRWEQTESLPTRRHEHHRRASVYAYRSELDQWWEARGSTVARTEPEVARPPRARLQRVLGVSILAIAAVLSYRWLGSRNASLETPTGVWRTTAITSYPGIEQFPSFSPDEQRLAFAWRREKSDNFDIYVQQVRSGNPVQLTTHPHHDWSPAWSPDGGSIAFIRFSPGSNAELIVMPTLPGSEHRLTTIAPLPGRGGIYGAFLAWSPDGAWIATSDKEGENDASGLIIVSTTTAEKRRLTRPGHGQRDTAPAFAPDGRSLVFVRVITFAISEIYQLPLTRDLQPAGPPTALTASRRMSTSPTWISAGTEVLFSSGDVFTDRRLYKTRISDRRASVRFNTSPSRLLTRPCSRATDRPLGFSTCVSSSIRISGCSIAGRTRALRRRSLRRPPGSISIPSSREMGRASHLKAAERAHSKSGRLARAEHNPSD